MNKTKFNNILTKVHGGTYEKFWKKRRTVCKPNHKGVFNWAGNPSTDGCEIPFYAQTLSPSKPASSKGAESDFWMGNKPDRSILNQIV